MPNYKLQVDEITLIGSVNCICNLVLWKGNLSIFVQKKYYKLFQYAYAEHEPNKHLIASIEPTQSLN